MRFPNNYCDELLISEASCKTYVYAKKTFEGELKNKIMRA